MREEINPLLLKVPIAIVFVIATKTLRQSRGSQNEAKRQGLSQDEPSMEVMPSCEHSVDEEKLTPPSLQKGQGKHLSIV